MSLMSKLPKRLRRYIYEGATILSPELNTRIRYREKYGRGIDLKDPKTFHEKLLWLKLKRYNGDPLVWKCADKLAVRDYVREKGCGDILNELYGVYERPEDIPWDELPDSFVLKWNFGSGGNLVCPDKAAIDREEAAAFLKRFGRRRYWLPYSEMQYKHMPRRILCEKFLTDGSRGAITDYKVYCFHGRPEAVFIMHDRGVRVRSEFFDTEWRHLENSEKYLNVETPTPRPPCLDEMLDAARALSAPFPFVRCDFYIAGEKLIFGELTFTPSTGLNTAQTKIHGRDMSEFLRVKE